MNAAQRSKTGQWGVVGNLGITQCSPAESGQQTFAGKFHPEALAAERKIEVAAVHDLDKI